MQMVGCGAPLCSHSILPTGHLAHPAVCAKFEQQAGRFPSAADADALVALAPAECAAAGLDAAALPDDQLRAYAEAGEADMPAINAVVGGVLANELIKAAGGRDAPLNNFFLCSLAEGGQGAVERMG